MKKLIKLIVQRLGYDIRPLQKHTSTRFGELLNPLYLSQICQPKTVIDVGVGIGTDWLYESFPSAHFFLIEPLKDYDESIRKIANQYECEVYNFAVGEKDDICEIKVDPTNLHLTSFSERCALTAKSYNLEKRTVAVTTLDNIYQESRTIRTPVLVKIDTEGHELQVLKGAVSLLQICDTVIAEVSIAQRFHNGYVFEEIIRFMEQNGFYLYSFLSIHHVPGELRPRFADVIFKRSIMTKGTTVECA
ncbi:MAG: FkbM family methyltransferase [Pirellulales bacterium]|nr:FkbM family methyltransferase [Pirellulales bacterium]